MPDDIITPTPDTTVYSIQVLLKPRPGQPSLNLDSTKVFAIVVPEMTEIKRLYRGFSSGQVGGEQWAIKVGRFSNSFEAQDGAFSTPRT